jgi:hypothetical protein
MEIFRERELFEFIEFLSEVGVYLGNSGRAGNAGARKILERSPRVTFCIQDDWSIGLNDCTKMRTGFIIRMHTKIPLAGDPADRFCTMAEFLFFSVIQNGNWRLIVYLLFQDAQHVWPRVLTRHRSLLWSDTKSDLAMVSHLNGKGLHCMGRDIIEWERF